jgi:exo-beta-1,3-glucanase (GH17 family)
MLHRLFLISFVLMWFAPASAAPVCAVRSEAATSLAKLSDVMQRGRFVAYQPTSLRVMNGQLGMADETSIAQDLRVLSDKFDGLITYGVINGAERIPDIAAKLGFKAVIVGIWDIGDSKQIANAIDAWQRNRNLVVGVSIGNETLFSKRNTQAQLLQAISTLRQRAPALALSTTEPFHMFDDATSQALLRQLDFLLINVHPVFQPWFAAAPSKNAAEFVVNVVEQLQPRFCGPILVKETGEPTAPTQAGYSSERQAEFYRELRQQFPPARTRAFAYFSAFDAAWRVNDVHPVPGAHPEEGSWGIYTEARAAKPAARELPALERSR